VLALATLANDPKSSPVGVTAAKIEWKKGLQEKRFNTDFRVLPSNSMGAYGQYYAGSLGNLGLIEHSEDGLDRASSRPATTLATAFQAAVAKTPYIRKRLFASEWISLEDLRATAKYLTIDALGEGFAEEERKGLTEVFFALSGRFSTDRHLLRRCTLLHLLHVIQEYEQHGTEIPLGDLDWYVGYPVYYYDLLWLTEARAVRYVVPAPLRTCHTLWRQFFAHQFLAHSLETVLWAMLEVLGQDQSGRLVAELVKILLSPDVFRRIGEITGQRCKTPADLLRAAEVAVDSMAQDARKAVKHSMSELSLVGERSDVAVEIARALVMLAVLWARWRKGDDAMRTVAVNAPHELWLGTILPLVESWSDAEIGWHRALEELISACILDQHDRIMYQKGRLDSSWLHRSDGRVFKDQDYEPSERTSRHGSAVSILADLGLVQISGRKCRGLTSAGRRLLQRLLKEADDARSN